jgi:hypothetical protein
VRSSDDVDGDARPDDGRHGGLDEPAEALSDPAAGMAGAVDGQVAFAELGGPQGLEPNAMNRLLDGLGKLLLDLRPDVVELGAHGSVDLLLWGESGGKSSAWGRNDPVIRI